MLACPKNRLLPELSLTVIIPRSASPRRLLSTPTWTVNRAPGDASAVPTGVGLLLLTLKLLGATLDVEPEICATVTLLATKTVTVAITSSPISRIHYRTVFLDHYDL